VLTLVIVAERIASSFSRRVIKPASRKHAPRRFYAHHRGTGSGILDRNAALEAGFGPVVDVTLAPAPPTSSALTIISNAKPQMKQ
jgi:hypothetical protein